MCFDERVSILTYIIGIIGCVILIKKNFYVEAIFYFIVIQMQLIEFFIWQNQECNNYNKIVTKLGLVINHLEPIILWIAINLFSKKILPDWIHYLMILYIFISIIYSKKVYGNYCTNVTPESKPYLYWKWNYDKYSEYYYLFFIIILNILCIYGVQYGYHMAFIINISYLITYILYGKYHAIGTMWCFAAAFAPLISIGFYQLDIRNILY